MAAGRRVAGVRRRAAASPRASGSGSVSTSAASAQRPAVCWVNDSLHVGCEIFQGDGAILDVADLVRSLARRYHVVELAFDPWRAGQLAQELEREGMTVSVFPQSDARMMPASAVLFDAITEQRITLPRSPELAQHAAGAIAKHSRRGWRIDKPNCARPHRRRDRPVHGRRPSREPARARPAGRVDLVLRPCLDCGRLAQRSRCRICQTRRDRTNPYAQPDVAAAVLRRREARRPLRPMRRDVHAQRPPHHPQGRRRSRHAREPRDPLRCLPRPGDGGRASALSRRRPPERSIRA